MCQLYTELVVHQLKIHKLAIQNVTKVSEVMPLHLLETDSESSGSDSETLPAEDSTVNEAQPLYEHIWETDDWFGDDADSHQSSEQNEDQSNGADEEPTNDTQIYGLKMCYKCNKSFSTFCSLRKHMTRMHGMSQADALEYDRFQREKKAPRKSSLYDNPVACRECNITFVRPTTLRAHYRRVHQMNVGEVNKLVPKRRRRNPDEIQLAISDGRNNEENRIISSTECYSCKECFVGVPALFEHFYRMHKPALAMSDEKRSSKSSGNRFVCKICNKAYQIRHKLHAHLITVHGLAEPEAHNQTDISTKNAAEQLMFVCEICQSAHPKRYTLRQHIIRTHALSKAEAWNLTKQVEPVPCPRSQLACQWICYVCKKLLAKKSTVRIHLERFHPIENSRSIVKIKKVLRIVPKVCHICHKKFRFDYTLQDHLEQAHGPSSNVAKKTHRVYACKHCDIEFNRAWKLDEHMKSLKRGKSIMCRKCFAVFDNRAELVQHMDRSENCRKKPMEKTALCTYCGESFVNKCSLDVHTRRHLDLRPFECEKCDQKFFTRLQLQRHQSAHVTEPQWFPCPVEGCGKSYLQSSYLKYHHRQKHSEATLKCPHCDKMFTTERYRAYVLTMDQAVFPSPVQLRLKHNIFSIPKRSCASAYWRETVQMQHLWQGLCTKIIDLRSSTNAHQSTPIRMRYLSEGN